MTTNLSSVGTLTELRDGSEVTATLNSPQEEHNYYFDVEPNQTVTITFTAPPSDYELRYTKAQYPLPKDGPVNAHTVAPTGVGMVQNLTFTESTKHRVDLTVASADGSTLPSSSYTIGMNVVG